MGLQVWSGRQVMVPLPRACWPLGQVTGSAWPTWKPCWASLPLAGCRHPMGVGQDLAVGEGNDNNTSVYCFITNELKKKRCIRLFFLNKLIAKKFMQMLILAISS
jgi:hypothetical protein